MARSLNRVQLIGNLTRDPELRYTPQGTAVCTFGLATNRSWTTDSGEKHEETEFHRIVSWNKLAELCSQFLVKGRKIYVEGRLSTRSWTGQDGAQKSVTEVVIDDMILLDSKGQQTAVSSTQADEPKEATKPVEKKAKATSPESSDEPKEEKKEAPKSVSESERVAPDEEMVPPDDIPF
ncbi:MAG: single-stranded DNA-binding protein [Candidatus Levybacteria bacterium]|nr:single-stranded DNA-binding protein [Candidatus Levybacteria bacterium]